MTSESDFVRGLRALGRQGAANVFSIPYGDVPIRVRYYPGSSSHLVLDAPYVGRRPERTSDYRGLRGALVATRPMEIVLRREDRSDAAAKAGGVAVEAQVGDPEFDRAVYVDSRSQHEVIGAVLAEAPLRAAVRALLDAGVGPITIDTKDATISLRVHAFSGLPADVTWTLGHLATIAASVPEVRASGDSHPEDVWRGRQIGMGVLCLLGAVPPLVLMFFALPERCYDSDGEGISLSCVEPGCCAPAQGGLALGLVLGLLAAVLVWPRIRGTSSSHRVRPWVAFFAVALCLEACFSVAHLVGGLVLR